MPDKIYTPEIIRETPFPEETSEAMGQVVKPVSGKVYSPAVSREKGFRKKRAAVELLSQALNTRSKKILKEFTFTESGALQIGKFLKGVSGDLRISPNGLTARDVAGLTTFAIDGSTGDAVFKGTLQAGSLILEGEMRDETGQTIIDAEGLVSTANFASDSAFSAPDTAFTDTSYTNVANSSMNIVLKRDAKVLILATVQSSHAQTAGGSNASGRVFYTVHLGGVAQNPTILIDASLIDATTERDNIIRKNYTTTMLKTVAKGTTVVKLSYRIVSRNNLTATLHEWSLAYVVLGT